LWNIKQVTDNDVEMEKLTTKFIDRELNWFMKYSNGQARTLAKVKATLTIESKNSKSESQCITELKEIK
jgi:hypothetical protein